MKPVKPQKTFVVRTVDELKPIKAKFIEEYDHLWSTSTFEGINGVGIGIGDDNSGEMGIAVMIEGGEDVWNKIPDTYEGVTVHKRKSGKIVAY